MAVEGMPGAPRSLSLSAPEQEMLQTVIQNWISLPIAVEQDLMADEKEARAWHACQGLRALLETQDLASTIVISVLDKAYRMADTPGTLVSGFVLYGAIANRVPTQIGQIVQRLRRGLVSDREAVAREAVAAVHKWLLMEAGTETQQHGLHLQDLVDEIGIAIAARRHSILANALDIATWIVQERPIYLQGILENCVHGLGCLLQEASYLRTEEFDARAIDKPRLRAASVRLASPRLGSGGGRPRRSSRGRFVAKVRRYRPAARSTETPRNFRMHENFMT